jgi:hypothetical protein
MTAGFVTALLPEIGGIISVRKLDGDISGGFD